MASRQEEAGWLDVEAETRRESQDPPDTMKKSHTTDAEGADPFGNEEEVRFNIGPWFGGKSFTHDKLQLILHEKS